MLSYLLIFIENIRDIFININILFIKVYYFEQKQPHFIKNPAIYSGVASIHCPKTG